MRTPDQVAIIIGLPAGIGAVAAYSLFIAAGMTSLPQPLVTTSAALFGPLLLIGSFGLKAALDAHRPSPLARLGLLLNLGASVLVTAMLLVQIGVHDAFPAAQDRSLDMRQVVQMVDRVQLGLDFSWDVFVAFGTAFFALAMLRHPKFGKVLGASGLLISAALFTLNLLAYPQLPTAVGWPDAGPLVGLWYLAVSLAMLRSLRWYLATPSSAGASRGALAPTPAAGA